MPLVEIQDLTFSYEGTCDILSEIGFTMEEGQSLLIVGDNGSGKTTLGRLMAGLIKPTKGRITIAGTKPSEVEVGARCRLVSYMGQVSHLSVLTSSIFDELLSFSHESEPMAAEDAYKDWARKHSLPEDTGINPRDLTTPDLWRLVVGLYAFVLQPALLVVDEVFCAGSKQQQDCARDVLEFRKRQKRATVFLYQRNLPLSFDAVVLLNNSQISPLPHD